VNTTTTAAPVVTAGWRTIDPSLITGLGTAVLCIELVRRDLAGAPCATTAHR
jgi:hypothetical protein